MPDDWSLDLVELQQDCIGAAKESSYIQMRLLCLW